MYTEIEEELKRELKELCLPVQAISKDTTIKNTAYFSSQSLGINPRFWQYKFWKALDEGKTRVACVTSRQIGKSVAVAIFALKVAAFNLRPRGFNKKTHVGIISASDEQSKKIMLEIRRLIRMGDEHIKRRTSGKETNFYSKMIDNRQMAANNKTTITFLNGNTIVCLPPTPRIRGYSFSYVFVDEAAFIEDDSVFFEYIEPTTANTEGVIVLTTTPNGQQGWFYEIFDPAGANLDNPYYKLWFHYTIIEDEVFQKNMQEKKIQFFSTGKEKKWEQEYDALFTTQTTAFFDTKDIEEAIDSSLSRLDGYARECDMGVDFGMVHSKTVITISCYENGKINLLFDYQYLGSDETLLRDIEELLKRFNIQRIVVDDCPEGHYIIQDLIRKGKNVTKMSFKAEKVAKYMALRKAFKQKKINIYHNTELISQLKALQQIEGLTNTRIQKPEGGRDDYPDSLLLSCYHFVEEEEDFDSEAIAAPTMEQAQELVNSEEWREWL